MTVMVFGCMNDMQHQGNWASPSISNEIMIVPSNEGVLHKYSITQNSFDLINKFPASDSKIGSFYGNFEIIDNVAYGISYGSDEGDKCQNKSCISYLFAVDVKTLKSTWPTEYIQIDGAVVGGIKYSNETLYFATTENDSFNEKGGFFYSVNSNNGDIIFKIPIASRVYDSIEINSQENIAILGDAKGNISLYNTSKESIANSERKIFTIETDYSIISPAIQLDGPNNETNYCVGNINGEIKCYELKELNLRSILKIDVNYKQVGSDRLVNAISVSSKNRNYIILDFGTATTFDVLIGKNYKGGIISPGISLSLNTLSDKASLIPKINLKRMSRVIGKDTKSAVRSGFFWGYAGLIDNIINLIKKETKKSFEVVATGGFSKLFKNSIKTKTKQDFDITINGLIKATKLIK